MKPGDLVQGPSGQKYLVVGVEWNTGMPLRLVTLPGWKYTGVTLPEPLTACTIVGTIELPNELTGEGETL
jgi:hypothetical protein